MEDAAEARHKLVARLSELIAKPDALEEGSTEYQQYQMTIEFTMQHLGITQEPKPKSASSQPQNVSNTHQAYLEQRERNRKIDLETSRIIQEEINRRHQSQAHTGPEFRDEMIAAKTNEEGVALQNEYKEQQMLANQELQGWIREVRANAEAKKKQ